MIAICEPQCREISHEKANSGFIYGLRLAYPQEAIRFYADITHIEAIKKILGHDNIIINNIEYIPIKFRDSLPIIGMLTYYYLFKKMFSNVLAAGTNKIFFLSFDPTILYIIKKLKQKSNFFKMKFTFVLHADFENIAGERSGLIFPSLPNKPIIERMRRTKPIDFPRKIAGAIIRFCWQPISTKLFSTKKILLWKHSVDYKYIALSPHIIENAEEFIDTKKFNFHTVVLPMAFAEPTSLPNNKHVKFAIFGVGDSFMLHNVGVQLSQKELKKPYEIRIIGRNNKGTDGFPNITCPSAGKPLTRGEMEKYARDIDIFLILYDKNRYRLSCTNSILEALSYAKPVLHFDNDCINNFNTHENPIGYCCNSLDEFVYKMEDIIENYERYKYEFQIFRENILKLRKEYAIENSLAQLRNSFFGGQQNVV